MFRTRTPHALLLSQLATLHSLLPDVRDGRPAAVHDARVATRRIRELVSLARPAAAARADDLVDLFRNMGRALGRVRDADARIDVLSALESRIPHAAPWLVTVRQQQERERLRLMRRGLKRLERLGVEALACDARRRGSPFVVLFTTYSRWRVHLGRTIVARSGAALEALTHAAGVYFPNRLHNARIALKKLRYAAEIAHETGTEDLASALNELKKAQDILGDLHDRQSLLDDTQAVDAGDPPKPDPAASLVRDVLEAEIRELHETYLKRRDAVVEACLRLQARPVGIDVFRPIAAAGALVIGSHLLTARR